MPAIRGITLKAFLEEFESGPWDAIPRSFLMHIMASLVDALDFLHTPSSTKPFTIAHGDLLPANIMLDTSHIPDAFDIAPVNDSDLSSFLPRIVLIAFGSAILKEYPSGSDSPYPDWKPRDINAFAETMHDLAHNTRSAESIYRFDHDGSCTLGCKFVRARQMVTPSFPCSDEGGNDFEELMYCTRLPCYGDYETRLSCYSAADLKREWAAWAIKMRDLLCTWEQLRGCG